MALLTLAATACSDIDNQLPAGGSLTGEQVSDATEAVPERINASFSGLFSMMGKPGAAGSSRYDDFGFISAAISQDYEGSDMVTMNSNYNWFSPPIEFSSRDANYANPYMRYVLPYRQIGVANEIINTIPEDSKNPASINMRAQAMAMRAFDYMALAPYFQFMDEAHQESPCVPLLDGKNEMSYNPRASVKDVFASVLEDLDWAVEHLTAERSDKSKINKGVALGLRARANLFVGKFAEAAADAKAALEIASGEGLAPASIDDISTPSFYSVNDANWMWGIIITSDMAQVKPYATSPSWMCAFSGDSYGAYAQLTPQINILLYNKIPASDARKNWWIDETLYSPLLDKVSWNGVSGVGISKLKIDEVKDTYLPYTNVKFGMKDGVGSVINSNDWPLMRVEEMYLIQAEGLAKSNNAAEATEVLSKFVRTYRDPKYNIAASGRSLEDEIWFQRRVELWGEGFFASDAKRLNKPIVRFHEGKKSNYPDDYKFNIAADDPWLNMRFPQDEQDNNKAIKDNKGGSQPVSGQNPELRDGVTD